MDSPLPPIACSDPTFTPTSHNLTIISNNSTGNIAYDIVQASNTSIVVYDSGTATGPYISACGNNGIHGGMAGQTYLPRMSCMANQTGQGGQCNISYNFTLVCEPAEHSMLSGESNAATRVYAGRDAAWLVLAAVVLFVGQLFSGAEM